ncbi:hypothetical protein BUALT_Bualt02G0185500 [Buddleja alternifolia]|uniref:Zinc finger PMZ-type domain-containing protein n=1 Tax=Buddleja alternifolia TaxID=168488 RepID=A0AAV6Y1B5_9LAMI|nr:hypothetical protein BUALT_Bualt02G0185500 [Buddleja alternifolia]
MSLHPEVLNDEPNPRYDNANEGVGDSDSEGEIEKGSGEGVDKSNSEGENKGGGDRENEGGGEGDSESSDSSSSEEDIMASEEDFNSDLGKWDLTGIPCHHAMSAICHLKLDPEDFAHVAYTVDNYLKVYKHLILPVNGPRLWAKTGFIPPMPPNFGRFVGKPATARRLEPDELARKKTLRSDKSMSKTSPETGVTDLPPKTAQNEKKRASSSAEVTNPFAMMPPPATVTSSQTMAPAPTSFIMMSTPRVNIRAPPPFSIMNLVLSQTSQSWLNIPGATPVPMLMKGGKKLCNHVQSKSVSNTNQTNKEKSKRDGKKKMPPWK